MRWGWGGAACVVRKRQTAPAPSESWRVVGDASKARTLLADEPQGVTFNRCRLHP